MPERPPIAGRSGGLDPLEHLPIAAYVDEIADDGTVWLNYGSRRYEELTGIAPRDLAHDAEPWDEHVHPDDRDAYEASFQALWRECVDQDTEYRFRRGDEWIWLHDRASAVRDEERGVTVINGVIADVTARRAAQEEAASMRASLEELVRERTLDLERTITRLRESEQNLAQAQKLASVGSFRLDTVQGTATGSDELYRMYGLEPGSPVDVILIRSATHPDDRAKFDRAMAAALAGDPRPAAELRIVRPDGEIRHVDVHAGLTTDDQGVTNGMFGSIQDVTERKQAEDEIRRLNAELALRVESRTEQLDATTRELEALGYSISHDVRSPLRIIDGFAAMVLEDAGAGLAAKDREHLDRVRDAARRMGELIDDLLGLSRVARRDMHRERCDLSSLAAEIGAELAEEHPGRRVVLTVQPGMTAPADPTLLRTIVRELLDNAWKFTARNTEAHVEVGETQADEGGCFFVRDDGVGFDPRYATHLFGAFQRMHEPGEFEGTGIGLATVQRLVRRHGGHVWAESEPGVGTTVSFSLPVDGA